MQDYSVSDPLQPDITDLRSDTITRPTDAMYARMRSAPIGDDGLDGDPSVRELEEAVATRLGKEAGLFVPTCTMANLLAVMSQTQRNQQLALEANAHMYTTERGGAVLAGLCYHPGAGRVGRDGSGAARSCGARWTVQAAHRVDRDGDVAQQRRAARCCHLPICATCTRWRRTPASPCISTARG